MSNKKHCSCDEPFDDCPNAMIYPCRDKWYCTLPDKPKTIKEMETGIELITKEREEQVKKHGYTLKTDNHYNKNGELAQVAKYLLSPHPVEQEWPRNWSRGFKDDIDRKSKIHKLKVAGALIAAELDRLQSLEV